MPDAPEVQPLSDADLLAWAVVLTHRSRQGRDGTLLLPYPPCPTCGEAVDAAWQVTTGRPDRLLRDIRLTVKPCGHVHTASEDRVHRLWSDIHEMVADVSDSYDGRVGRDRRWTTEGIVHEAQARTASAKSEGAEPPAPPLTPRRFAQTRASPPTTPFTRTSTTSGSTCRPTPSTATRSSGGPFGRRSFTWT